MNVKRSGGAPEYLDIQLPPLRRTLIEAVALMHQPEGPSFEQVLNLVEYDPAVATRILYMVNSAYYGQRRFITSLHRAVMIMGTVPVLGVVMGMSLQQAQIARPAGGSSMQLIRHSVATAFLARHLFSCDPAAAGAQEPEGQRAVFTAALLHDVGKLVLLYNHPEAAAQFYRAAVRSTPDAEMLEQERALFGYDHVAAGVYLGEHLQFPHELKSAIAWHHRYGQFGTEPTSIKHVVYPVAAANKTANALGHALNHPTTVEACCGDPIWALLLEARVVGYESPKAIFEELLAANGELAAFVEAVV